MNLTKELILTTISEKGELLLPNQRALSIPIIERIHKKMLNKIKFPPIHVSSDNLIVNGHHRYISSLLSDFEIEIVSNYPKPSFLNDFTWETVEFTTDDWDSPSKIKMLNAMDARYNNMTIGEIESIIE